MIIKKETSILYMNNILISLFIELFLKSFLIRVKLIFYYLILNTGSKNFLLASICFLALTLLPIFTISILSFNSS